MGKCSFCKQEGHNKTTCPRLKKQHRERDKLGRFLSRRKLFDVRYALAHPDSIAIFLDIFNTLPQQDIEKSYIMAQGFIYAYVHEFGMQAQQGTLIEELNSNYQKRMDYDE